LEWIQHVVRMDQGRAVENVFLRVNQREVEVEDID
jgi:hypothetical protein